MSSHTSLDAAAQDRRARLAQLKSLKRKQPDTYQEADTEVPPAKVARSPSPTSDVTQIYLSGRNYDPSTRGPKLGFESAPSTNTTTLEAEAERLAAETRAQVEEEAKADKPLDLFKLQPKKPNWDLKRDLDRKLEVLNVRTENAIARLVRERIEAAQKAAAAKGGGDADGTDGEAVGMEGVSLVEAINVREREDEEDERRAREEDDDMGV